jgi:hypothetical protein
MKLIEALVIAFYVCVALSSIYMYTKVAEKEPQLMCGVAEISPDFSAQDRERCRQPRGHKL